MESKRAKIRKNPPTTVRECVEDLIEAMETETDKMSSTEAALILSLIKNELPAYRMLKEFVSE